MELYSIRQLVVILLTLSLIGALAVVQRITAVAGRCAPADVPRAAWAYEVRGAVAKEGFYFFHEPQPLGRLLSVCGCEALQHYAGACGEYQALVPNGCRVTVGERIDIVSLAAAVRLVFFLPLCLTTASAEDLALIPGIGSRTAEAIVAYRQARNEIRDIQELRSVKGIGAKKIGAFAPYLTTHECFEEQRPGGR